MLMLIKHHLLSIVIEHLLGEGLLLVMVVVNI